MPRRLPDRFADETTAEFTAAALARYRDGVVLAAAGRRAGAIYVWGYSAEMLLKAAYFRLIGYAEDDPIRGGDLRAAQLLGADVAYRWPPGHNLHFLPGWAELLVRTRIALPGCHYPDPGFGAEVIGSARRVWHYWRETIRYHKNAAYNWEADCVRTGVEWLLGHSREL